jgi:radical SAM protein with 4Fe4S-binding SPASM domain
MRRGVLYDVHFDLTYKCNLNCLHCYVNRDKKGKLLSAVEVKRILDDLALFGILSLTFSGGEIFSRSDVLEILDYAAKKRFEITLKTNGTLLTQEIARHLSRNKFIREFAVTILGARADTHDFVTRVKGSHSKTLKGVKLHLKYIEPNRVLVNYTTLKENYSEIPIARKYFNKLGCKFRGGLIRLTSSWKNAGSSPQVHRLSVLEKYNCLKSNSSDNLIKIRSHGFSRWTCKAGLAHLYIDPFGYGHPCVDLVGINLGSVLNRGIRETWKNRSIRGFRVKDFSVCWKCPQLKYCQICPATNYLENKSFYKPSEEVCNMALASKMFLDSNKD